MSDVNLIKDKIREEFEKGFPSKKKVISYLLDLLNKDKYPSLSDNEFYDIVGYTYKLNLTKASSYLSKKFGSKGVLKNAYNLRLKILFYHIYDDLKKKIRKLYGDEKWLEMEKYLIKNYGLFKEGYEQDDPSMNPNWKLYRDLNISALFSQLFPIEENQHLSDSEFFDIVGEAFKSNPEFYMENLYEEVRKRVKKLYGDEKLKEMIKNLLEKYSLYDGEQILFESKGDVIRLRAAKVEPSGRIKLDSAPVSVSIKSGNIVVTNYRLIAQGKLKVRGGRDRNAIMWGGLVGHLVTGGSSSRKRDESRERLIDGSLEQELPCYGYQFLIQNHAGLEKRYSNPTFAYGIRYAIQVDNIIYRIQINLSPGAPQAEVNEQANAIFKILCKDKNQVLNIIKEQLEMDVIPERKQAELLLMLEHLRTKEEYRDISDSEYLDIVGKTYRLNPQYFMDSIYPKMKSWKFSSFINIKDEFLELLENLNKETG